jgi:hypothetical protein
MIIDNIIDAKEGSYGGLRPLYDYAVFFQFMSLASALDCGENADIQDELCKYIDSQGYSPALKKFVRSFKWIPENE